MITLHTLQNIQRGGCVCILMDWNPQHIQLSSTSNIFKTNEKSTDSHLLVVRLATCSERESTMPGFLGTSESTMLRTFLSIFFHVTIQVQSLIKNTRPTLLKERSQEHSQCASVAESQFWLPSVAPRTSDKACQSDMKVSTCFSFAPVVHLRVACHELKMSWTGHR